jgi:hypothetical protein
MYNITCGEALYSLLSLLYLLLHLGTNFYIIYTIAINPHMLHLFLSLFIIYLVWNLRYLMPRQNTTPNSVLSAICRVVTKEM